MHSGRKVDNSRESVLKKIAETKQRVIEIHQLCSNKPELEEFIGEIAKAVEALDSKVKEST